MSNMRALPHNFNQILLEIWILAGQLEGEGWEDLLEIAAVLEVSGLLPDDLLVFRGLW